MNSDDIINHWQKKGIRITPTRKSLLSIFISKNKPLSVSDILSLATKAGLHPNKTTVYREIDFFSGQGFIREVYFRGRKKYYEINKSHHHHLVCRKCKSVHAVESDEMESAISKIQKTLKKKTSFYNIDHSLEFYGLCPNCIS